LSKNLPLHFTGNERPVGATAREAKSCLRSWRQSADTVTSARRSKVIGGRIYDAAICLNRSLICPNIEIGTENDARVRSSSGFLAKPVSADNSALLAKGPVCAWPTEIPLLPENGRYRLSMNPIDHDTGQFGRRNE
jgi:hypothetical protein